MTFMRAYQDMVFTTAARLAGDDAQAEDISQDVFLRAYQHFPELRDSPTAGGWLKTVTTNLALNHLTRHRRRWRLFSELAGKDEDSDAPDLEWEVPETVQNDIDDTQRAAIIDAALRQLPSSQRIPLVLYHYDELSYQDIADRLKVSLAKVKTDISRGRSALLPKLAEAGIVRVCP